ncbi:plasmid mobilization relaxosome protein MobC [Pseudomonas juntendi]|uniref:Plasmid mobilization relaxosome protein MobC n=1 Tax=Pseudomonas juntendi TaxID=2666183 RepID=A0A7W2LYI3_9PSED|nr:plasmid mobilization relaxosome protein MobC [Pseudomonas juntendi]MBA6134013.1 plasmid mobilization relaxosome protein MobC [Pseudomonas juntendi]MBA6149378.1 plasmid mobilization relaxosome protein MobC [Pseudomonas juntendi]
MNSTNNNEHRAKALAYQINQHKEIMKNRNARITIRASTEHIAKLNQLSADFQISKTDLLKKIIDDGFGQTVEIINPELLAAFVKIDKMLDSIGNNINQMARKVNSGSEFTEQDRKTLEAVSSRFETLSDLIANKTRKTVIKKRGSK